jgi:hypothetical protein
MGNSGLIDVLIICTSVVLIISKFFDCYTTIIVTSKLGLDYKSEKNPLARFFMKYFGFKKTVWGIFTFVVLLAVGLGYEFYVLNNIYYSIFYIIFGVLVLMAQFDVARSNYFGKSTFFIKNLSKFFSKLSK